MEGRWSGNIAVRVSIRKVGVLLQAHQATMPSSALTMSVSALKIRIRTTGLVDAYRMEHGVNQTAVLDARNDQRRPDVGSATIATDIPGPNRRQRRMETTLCSHSLILLRFF